MKHLKKYLEKIETTNFKDLESWSPEGNRISKEYNQKSGKKDIDKELGQKVLDYFEENNINFNLSETDTYCKNQDILIPGEDDLVEVRVVLHKELSLDNWFILHEDMDSEEFLETHGEEQYKELLSIFEKDSGIIDMKDCLFSTFLPTSDKKDKVAAIYDASMYLKLLNNSIPEVIKGSIGNYKEPLMYYGDEFEKFVRNKKVNINNDNFMILTNISNRLYKDCKFFSYLEKEMESNEFIKGWLEVIGETPNF